MWRNLHASAVNKLLGCDSRVATHAPAAESSEQNHTFFEHFLKGPLMNKTGAS